MYPLRSQDPILVPGIADRDPTSLPAGAQAAPDRLGEISADFWYPARAQTGGGRMDDFYDEDMAARQQRLANTPDMARQRDALLRKLALQPGEAVLEIGTGNGILARDMVGRAGPAGRVTGVDASEAILATARHICPEAEFLLADAQSLSFDESTFDVVTGAQVLCFVADVDRALAEAFRVLKPGGRLVLLDTDWDTLVWNSGDPRRMARVMQAYTAVYADPHLPRSLGGRLKRAGFADVTLAPLVLLNTTFGADTYARQTANFALPIMEASADITPQEAADWLQELETLDATGGFFFSLNRYIASAVKPPT